MKFLIITLVVLFGGLAVEYARRRRKASQLIAAMRQMGDTEPWRAAVELTKRVKPHDVVSAQSAFDEAQTAWQASLRSRDPRECEYRRVDLDQAKSDLDRAIANDVSARSVYSRVASIISNTITKAMKSPMKAPKFHKELAPAIERVIADVTTYAQRNRLAPITDEEVEAMRRGLYDGTIDRWVRTLKA